MSPMFSGWRWGLQREGRKLVEGIRSVYIKGEDGKVEEIGQAKQMQIV